MPASCRADECSKAEHRLRQKQAAEALRSLVVLRAGIRADLHVLAPEIIQAGEVRDRGCIRLVDIGGEPVGAGQRFPVRREAPAAEGIAAATVEQAIARPDLLGTQVERAVVVTALGFGAAFFLMGGGGKAGIPVAANGYAG